MGFGNILKQLLEHQNMTIKELSEKTGISLNTLYAITKRDNNNVRADILQKISIALNIPTSELISLLSQEMGKTQVQLNTLNGEYYRTQELLRAAHQLKAQEEQGRKMLSESLKMITGYDFSNSEITTIIQTAKVMKMSTPPTTK